MTRRPVRLGDRVTITSTPCGRFVGTRGRLTAIDHYADLLEPYHVSVSDGSAVWASTVRRCRIQWSADPGVHALVLLALAALVTAVLVILV